MLMRFPGLCRSTDLASSSRLNWLPCMIDVARSRIRQFQFAKFVDMAFASQDLNAS